MHFQKIKLDTWARKEYFEHYFSIVPCMFSMTVKLDITHIVKSKAKLYPAMLYSIVQIINRHEEFRTALDTAGNLGVYDTLIPCYTVFHKKSETFSTIWTEAGGSYTSFYQAYHKDLDIYGNQEQFEGKPHTPKNVCNISMIPWESFDGFHLHCPEGKDFLLPIFTMGKYYKEGEQILLPLAIQVHHAVCDGFHVCRFVQELREYINAADFT